MKMLRDPMLLARDIIYERLTRDIEDDERRFRLATAISVNLDMCHVLVTEKVDDAPLSV